MQDLLPSPASEIAHYVLPAAAFTEKDGTFVNHAGLAQAIRHACQPPLETHTDGQVFFDLAERRGLAHAATMRAELARRGAVLRGFGAGRFGEHGIRLV